MRRTAADPLQDPALHSPFADGRQSEAALEIARGTGRLLRAHGLASLSELPLANGRRADLAAIDAKGEIWIVEVKSSLGDFRADDKWPEYLDYCDRFFFAVSPTFPREVLPLEPGVIVADRFGAEILRPSPVSPLSGARRKVMLIAFARAAALRIQAAIDPEIAG